MKICAAEFSQKTIDGLLLSLYRPLSRPLYRGLVTSLMAGLFFLGASAIASTIAPTKPQGISITSANGGLLLHWRDSHDADGVVVAYELIKNGTLQWLGNANSFSDSAVSQGVTYAYNLIAVDNQGNRSTMSDTVTYRFSRSSSEQAADGVSMSGGSIGSGGSTAAACVDTDGDGWGWDGTKSCRVTSSGTTQVSSAAVCVDEDGDGYGWDGSQSCRMDQAGNSQKQCIDSDGDGYGWDGESSCIP